MVVHVEKFTGVIISFSVLLSCLEDFRSIKDIGHL
jgi:hypothetical protein